MRGILLTVFLAACDPISSAQQPLTVDVNGGDTVTIDPVLKSGSDLQFRSDTTTWTSADGFSITYRGDFYAYSVSMGQRVDMQERPRELDLIASMRLYSALPLTFSGTEIAP